jgi:hypothetical protein
MSPAPWPRSRSGAKTYWTRWSPSIRAYLHGNFEKVIEIHGLYQNVPANLYLVLAAACAQAGRYAHAKAVVADYERLRPAGQDALSMIKHQMRMCWRQEDRDRWFEGYRRAGFPV